MQTFAYARQAHAVVARAAMTNEVRARGLWNALAGLEAAPRGSAAEAAADTIPTEHAGLLVTDAVAVAYAFEVMLEVDQVGAPHQLRERARAAWSKFSERAAAAGTIAEGFGWDLSAAWAHTRDITPRSADMATLERVARLAGRMVVALCGGRTARSAGQPGEVYSVEQGNAIGRLLPSELVQLTDPHLEVPVLQRIATRRAAQYAVRGPAIKARGPLVVAIDESGSMHAARNEWAKAAALALCRVAAQDGRPVAVVHFSTSTVAQELRPRDPVSVLAMVRHFLSGGTAIGLALSCAVEQVRALARKGAPGADIILITDGLDHDIGAQKEALRQAGVAGARLWTVAIECNLAPADVLRSGAAQYTELGAQDLGDSASVVALAGAA